MVTITRYNNRITIEGHAGYAPQGQDIVCAAVSTLVQVFIQSVEDLCTDPISYHLKPGWVEIKHGNPTKEAKLLLDSFFIGCYMISDRHPNHVKIAQARKA